MTEFKIGDLVRCKPGFTNKGDQHSNDTGGAGYKEHRVFIISSVSNRGQGDIRFYVYWAEDLHNRGVYGQALELVNKPQYQIW